MAGGSYLQRIAQRSVQGTPLGLRPPRAMRGLSEPAREIPAPPAPIAGAVRAPIAASMETPSAAHLDAHVRAAAPSPRHDVEPMPPSMPRETIAVDSARPSLAPPVPDRPVASLPAPAVEPAVPDPAPSSTTYTPAPVVANAPPPTSAEPPRDPRRTMSRRNVSVAPDPLAVALAAAVRWSSSDEAPTPVAAIRADHEQRLPIVGREPDVRHDEPLVEAARRTAARSTPLRPTPATPTLATATPATPMQMPTPAAPMPSPAAARRDPCEDRSRRAIHQAGSGLHALRW